MFLCWRLVLCQVETGVPGKNMQTQGDLWHFTKRPLVWQTQDCELMVLTTNPLSHQHNYQLNHLINFPKPCKKSYFHLNPCVTYIIAIVDEWTKQGKSGQIKLPVDQYFGLHSLYLQYRPMDRWKSIWFQKKFYAVVDFVDYEAYNFSFSGFANESDLIRGIFMKIVNITTKIHLVSHLLPLGNNCL